jgi:hypothetical protein
MSRLPRNGLIGWASIGTVLVVSAVVASTMLASASAPTLPRRSAAQLIAGLRHASMPPAASGTITEIANLGLPALPDLGGVSSGASGGSALSPASWLTGTHVVQFWYAPGEVRLAVPAPFGESDLRVNGNQIWLWSSQSRTATRLLLTPPLVPAPVRGWFLPVPRPDRRLLWPAPMRITKLGPTIRVFGRCVRLGSFRELMPSGPRSRTRCVKISRVAVPQPQLPLPKTICGPIALHPVDQHNMLSLAAPPAKPAGRSQPTWPIGQRPLPNLTPLQAARRLLALAGPTTKITVAGTTTVAGRAAYQLAIEPRSGKSLIGRIVIAIDAKSHLPLQVQVFARGSSSPAFQLGFTSLTVGRPAKSNFTFTPPPGAHVKILHVPGPVPPLGGLGTGGPIGVGGAVMGVPPSFPRFSLHSSDMPLDLVGHLRASSLIAGTGCRLPRLPANAAPVQMPPAGMAGMAGPRILGSGWLSVIALPARPLTGGSTVFRSRGSTAYSSSMTVTTLGPAGPQPPLLHLVLAAARPVHGSWGSGRLLRTALFSVLITSKGQVLIGAVTPSVLFADAAQVK